MVDRNAFSNLAIDYVGFYVDDIERNISWLVDGYGFTIRDDSSAVGTDRSVRLGQGEIDLRLTKSGGDHPARAYVARHGDGVADIGIRVPDAAEAFTRAVAAGARPVRAPVTVGAETTASIMGFGDVTHTFVQRPDHAVSADPAGVGLVRVDHFAVCVESGTLAETVEFYRRTLGFELTLSEHIVTGDQGMFVQVVQSESRAVTFTLVEADASMASGQIDTFLKDHDGPGVQHMAFSTTDILTSVGGLAERGVRLLTTPAAYYDALGDRVRSERHSVARLRELNILLDEDHDGQLYQIFAKSVHPRNTIFLEIIERAGATTFGSSNIKNLYDAVETVRNQDSN